MSLTKKSIFKDIFKYSFIVTFGLLLDLIILVVLVNLDLNYFLAYIIGFFCGTILNIILLRKFHKVAKFHVYTDIFLSLLANSSTFFIGLGVFWLLINYLSFGPINAKLISIAFTFAVNYVARRKFFH